MDRLHTIERQAALMAEECRAAAREYSPDAADTLRRMAGSLEMVRSWAQTLRIGAHDPAAKLLDEMGA